MKTIVYATSTLLAIAVLSARADEEKADAPKTRDVKVEDITLKIPESWTQAKPSNSLRKAQFELPTKEGDPQSEMYVSHFASDGGGVKANVFRWMKQFDREGREMKVVQGKSEQGEYTIVDVTGTFNMPVGPVIQRKTRPVADARLVGVILHVEGKGNYFLKMTGTQRSLKKQADLFRTAFGADADTEKPFDPFKDSTPLRRQR